VIRLATSAEATDVASEASVVGRYQNSKRKRGKNIAFCHTVDIWRQKR